MLLVALWHEHLEDDRVMQGLHYARLCRARIERRDAPFWCSLMSPLMGILWAARLHGDSSVLPDH